MVKERYNEYRLGECGSDVHNVQIFPHDSGKVLSDDEIVDVYMRTYELSDKISVSSVLRKSQQYVVRASREG